jgi:hypothetical protein
MTRSEQFKNIPPRKNIVRIERYLSQTLICSDGAKGLKCMLKILIKFHILYFFFVAVFIYYEDPRGNIPKAVWIWAAKVCKDIFTKLNYYFFLF